MTVDMLQNQADEISNLLIEKLRIKGGTLADQAQRGKKLLPRGIYRDLLAVEEAVALAEHPKLSRVADVTRARASAARVIAHLKKIDRWELIKTRWIGVLSLISFVAIAVFILVVYVLWKRGLV